MNSLNSRRNLTCFSSFFRVRYEIRVPFVSKTHNSKNQSIFNMHSKQQFARINYIFDDEFFAFSRICIQNYFLKA